MSKMRRYTYFIHWKQDAHLADMLLFSLRITTLFLILTVLTLRKWSEGELVGLLISTATTKNLGMGYTIQMAV